MLSIAVFLLLVLWCLSLFQGMETKSIMPKLTIAPLGSGEQLPNAELGNLGLQFLSTPTVVAAPSLGAAGDGG